MENTKSIPRFKPLLIALFILSACPLSANASLDTTSTQLKQNFIPTVKRLSWINELVRDEPGSIRSKMLNYLTILDTQWVDQAQFSRQIPRSWIGFWGGITGETVDVFSHNVYYSGRLYRVVGALEKEGALVFQLGTILDTISLVLIRSATIDDSESCILYKLGNEKFQEPESQFVYRRKRTLVQAIFPGLYGEYVGSSSKLLPIAKSRAVLGKRKVIALKRNWIIKSRGEVFMRGRRAFRVYAWEEKTGIPGYFLIEKPNLNEYIWHLSLSIELSKFANQDSFIDLGSKFAKVYPRQYQFPYFLIVIALVVGLILYGLYRRRVKVMQQEQARTQLVLSGLRAQLNPHFLFNALTSIQDLVNQDNKPAANRYFNEISQLLRYVVDSSNESFMPLAAELSALERYCALEALRTPFQYTLAVRPEIDQQNVEIPTMLLQPFVENAILHGLRPGTEPKELKISIWPEGDDRIGISILDNGIGIEESQRQKDGLQGNRGHQGMATTQKRIDLLNQGKKEKITLRITDRGSFQQRLTGTIVQFSIPI
jgi:two-component system, LytTR family, sensor kinase